MRVGSLFGIELRADYSVLLIFALIAANLGFGFLPRWHPQWSGPLTAIVALVAGVLFVGSIALHELSHALVGRHYGVDVQGITLFVFGGVTHMKGEPPSPKSEFLIAVVGPLTSLIIGSLSVWIGSALAHPLMVEYGVDAMEEVARHLSPIATLLLWLGPLNIVLAVFNLLPGFPLDGGRVLRALLWFSTGDLPRATRWASALGQGFGALLIALGVVMALGARVPFFGVGLGSGLWLALIGWFLGNAARTSARQLALREMLAHVLVREIMRSQVDTVQAEVTLDALARDYFTTRGQEAVVVERDGKPVGIVRIQDLGTTPRERWHGLTAADVMLPLSAMQAVHPDDDAMEALQRLAEQDPLAVVDEQRNFVGIARREDVLNWLTLHARPA
jgi:Zn-dependent protease/CBS domain-containing protein